MKLIGGVAVNPFLTSSTLGSVPVEGEASAAVQLTGTVSTDDRGLLEATSSATPALDADLEVKPSSGGFGEVRRVR